VISNALFVTMLSRDQAMLALMGLANVQLLIDTLAFKRGLMPEWYVRLRMPVALTLIASLGITYAVITQDLSQVLVSRS